MFRNDPYINIPQDAMERAKMSLDRAKRIANLRRNLVERAEHKFLYPLHKSDISFYEKLLTHARKTLAIADNMVAKRLVTYRYAKQAFEDAIASTERFTDTRSKTTNPQWTGSIPHNINFPHISSASSIYSSRIRGQNPNFFTGVTPGSDSMSTGMYASPSRLNLFDEDSDASSLPDEDFDASSLPDEDSDALSLPDEYSDDSNLPDEDSDASSRDTFSPPVTQPETRSDTSSSQTSTARTRSIPIPPSTGLPLDLSSRGSLNNFDSAWASDTSPIRHNADGSRITPTFDQLTRFLAQRRRECQRRCRFQERRLAEMRNRLDNQGVRSDYFRRDRADIHSDVEINVSQALLGGTVRVPGPYEEMALKVKPGTSSHTRMRVYGKGRYGYGDHYVNFKIKVPTNLTNKQKALMKVFAELEPHTTGTIDGLEPTEPVQSGSLASDVDLYADKIRSALNGSDSDSEILIIKEVLECV